MSEVEPVFVKMRAKVRIGRIDTMRSDDGTILQQRLRFAAVGRNQAYPADGLDEDNTFAKFTPNLGLDMTVANPALFEKFTEGEVFYLDFVPAKPRDLPATE